MGSPARRPVQGTCAVTAIAAALAAAAVLAPPATAATAVSSGWWTAAPVSAPDAGDGLLVQGGAGEPTALAAIGYELAPDEDVVGITLTVAEGSATTPATTLRVCPLTQGFEPGAGQPAEEAPAYDCTVSAEAAPSADGRGYAFDLTGFAGAEALGVAVLPTTPTDRVVLEAPGPEAVESAASPTPGPPGPVATSPAGPTAPPSRGAGPSSPGGRSAAAPAPPRVAIPPATPTPRGATAATPDPAAEVDAPAPTPLSAPQPVSAGADPAADATSPLPLLVFAALAATAAALWGLAGRDRSPAEPQPA